MAITRTDSVKFLFENSNGRLYAVSINKDTGSGTARLLTQVNSENVVDDHQFDLTETTVTVDSGSLSAWQGYHPSRRIYAAVYNTSQDLNTILNAS